MARIDVIDFVMSDADELFGTHGVPKEEASMTRLALTGHERPLSPKWMQTIGLWGGVVTTTEIAQQLDLLPEQVRSQARRWGLKSAREDAVVHPARIAVLAYADRGTDPEQTRRRLGILPVELVLYRVVMEEFLAQQQVTFSELLLWNMERVERWWSRDAESIAPPEWTLRECAARARDAARDRDAVEETAL